MEGERNAKAPTDSATSCNVSLYTGASSAVTSPPILGAAALAQVSCTGGCSTFTITSQACCAGVCTPVATQSRLVCQAAWTAGSIRQGAYTSGSAVVSASPPGVSQSSAFTCQ
jgi:hypothetical protein